MCLWCTIKAISIIPHSIAKITKVTKIKMLTLENAANIYSVFNGVKFGASDKQEKHLLYPQFVAYL